MRSPIALLSASLALLALAAPGLAAASPTFPGALTTNLQLEYSPPCTVCHPGATGLGTATSEFAVAMRDRGLAAADTASLATALDQMEADNVDSDGDGTIDVEQLKAGKDPSTGAQIGPDSGAVTVTYGCGAQIAPGDVPWEGAVAAMTAIAGLLLARGRRRRR
jgi:hypothetical protein